MFTRFGDTRILPAALMVFAMTGACELSLAQVPGSIGVQVYPSVSLSVGVPVGKLPVLERSSIEVPYFVNVQPGSAGVRPTYDLVVCAESGSPCELLPKVTPPWSSRRKLT